MTQAQAAQQSNRDNGGKYATKTHAEADGVDLNTSFRTTTRHSALALPGHLGPAERLRYSGMVMTSRATLKDAAEAARDEYGQAAHSLEFTSDDGLSTTFTVHSSPEPEGTVTTLGAVDVDGVFTDNGVDDLKTDVDSFSVTAAAKIDLNDDAATITWDVTRAHLLENTIDYTIITPADVDDVLDGLEGHPNLDVSDLTDEQRAELKRRVAEEFELSKHTTSRQWDDFNEAVREELGQILDG